VPAEQEWAELLARFPALARQFEDATLAFPWISTGRTQFSSSVTVGDRWVLMSHAAGAIDALFSRGMANTMAIIEAFMSTYFKARQDGDFSARRFAYIDTLNQSVLDNNDKLVAGSYIAFRDFDLWRAWSKMWYLAWNLGVVRIAGTYYQYLETGDATVLDRLHKGELPGTFCPELASSQQQFTDCYQVMRDVAAGQLTSADAVAQLAWILDDGEASPAPLNLQDVLRRWHDGSQETQRMIYQWGRTAAPVLQLQPGHHPLHRQAGAERVARTRDRGGSALTASAPGLPPCAPREPSACSAPRAGRPASTGMPQLTMAPPGQHG
jgi:FADH2 O2-dependent halogenase